MVSARRCFTPSPSSRCLSRYRRTFAFVVMPATYRECIFVSRCFVTTEVVSLQDEESARVLDVVEFDGKKGGFNANTHVENLYVAILPAGWRLTKWGAVLRTADLPRQDEPGHISCPIPSVSSPVPSHPVLPCSDPWPWAAVIAFHSHQSGVV